MGLRHLLFWANHDFFLCILFGFDLMFVVFLIFCARHSQQFFSTANHIFSVAHWKGQNTHTKMKQDKHENENNTENIIYVYNARQMAMYAKKNAYKMQNINNKKQPNMMFVHVVLLYSSSAIRFTFKQFVPFWNIEQITHQIIAMNVACCLYATFVLNFFFNQRKFKFRLFRLGSISILLISHLIRYNWGVFSPKWRWALI